MKEYLQERETRIRGRRHKRKQGRAARVRRQVLRYSMLSFLFFVGICGFSNVSWTLRSPESDIVVLGNQVVESAQVKRVLGPYLHKPLYMINPKELEAKIKALPDVHDAFVRRYLLPHPHLVVNLMEEFPWATFSCGPELAPIAVISQTGRFIPLSQFPAVQQPSLKIFGNPSTKLNSIDVVLWSNWANYISKQTGREVNSIDLRKPADIQVQATDLCLHIGAQDSTFQKRLARLASIVPVVASLKENIDYVDLSLDSNVPLKVSKLPKKAANTTPSNNPAILPPAASLPAAQIPATASPSPVATAPSVHL